jgi:hypothetical protein
MKRKYSSQMSAAISIACRLVCSGICCQLLGALCEKTLADPITEWSEQKQRIIPPVDRNAPFTRKVSGLLAVLTLDEKLSLAYGASDPNPAPKTTPF